MTRRDESALHRDCLTHLDDLDRLLAGGSRDLSGPAGFFCHPWGVMRASRRGRWDMGVCRKPAARRGRRRSGPGGSRAG
jgi:hypothetical protein